MEAMTTIFKNHKELMIGLIKKGVLTDNDLKLLRSLSITGSKKTN